MRHGGIDHWTSAASCTADVGCTPSTAAMLLPAACGVLVIAFGLGCWRIAVRARRADGPRLTLVASTVGALAVVCAVLLGSMFRHFGGDEVVGQGGSAYACEAWWYQVGTTAGATQGDHLPSHRCRQAAVGATGLIAVESAGSGVVAGAALMILLTVRRRRLDRRLADLTG